MPGDQFGTSVALDGRLALVGSRTDQTAPNAGSVYVFDVLRYTFRTISVAHIVDSGIP